MEHKQLVREIISEMKDLLLLTLQTYEEDLKKEPLTKEEIARINDWGKEKLDSIMEYHNNYLISKHDYLHQNYY